MLNMTECVGELYEDVFPSNDNFYKKATIVENVSKRHRLFRTSSYHSATKRVRIQSLDF